MRCLSLFPGQRMRRPRPRRDVVLGLALAVLSAAYYLAFATSFLPQSSLNDEGFLLYGTLRFMDGQRPMVDFWAYPPGRYAYLAAVFSLFGASLGSARVGLAALLVLRNVLMFAVARRFMTRPWAVLFVVGLALLPGLWHKVFYSLLAFANLWAALRYLEKPGLWRAAALGGIAGGTVLFRQDAGLVALMLMGLAVVLGSPSWRTRLTHTTGALVVSLWFCLVFAGLYGLGEDAGTALKHFGPQGVQVTVAMEGGPGLIGPSKVWAAWMKHLAESPNARFLDALSAYALLGAGAGLLGLGLFAAWRWMRRRPVHTRRTLGFVLLSGWALAMSWKMVSTPTLRAALMVGPVMGMACWVVIGELWRWHRRGAATRPAHVVLPGSGWASAWGVRLTAATMASLAVLLVWGSVGGLLIRPIEGYSTGGISDAAGASTRVQTPRGGVLLPGPEAARLQAVVDAIEANTEPGEAIFAYRQPMLYFLTGRENATALDNLVPPVVLPEQADALEAVFTERPPRIQVVDVGSPWTKRVLDAWPGELGAFVFEGYRVRDTLEGHLILKRRRGASAGYAVDRAFAEHRRARRDRP